jgi:hypothetical protein
LRIGQDRLEGGDRLGRERCGLLAPSDGLVATAFDKRAAKNGRTKPIAYRVAVNTDGFGGGGAGGTRGQQDQRVLLGHREVGIGLRNI